MYRVTEIVEFCYGHRLLRYQGKCAHLHGHNGKVEIELASGSLNAQSMVADFSDIGRIVKSWIDQNLDHRMLLHRDDPLVEVLRRHDEPVFLMDSDPTAEALARPLLWLQLKALMIALPIASLLAGLGLFGYLLATGSPATPDEHRAALELWGGTLFDLAFSLLLLYSTPLCIRSRERGERGPHV